MTLRPLMCLAACLLLAGCASSSPRYPNGRPKNVVVNLHYVHGGGPFSSNEAMAGINDITKGCSTQYKGWVKLSEGRNEIGLRIGQPTLLMVALSGSFLGNYSSHTMERGVLIVPKRGVRYEVDVSYVDMMYDIRLYRLTNAGKRRLPIYGLPAGCRALH